DVADAYNAQMHQVRQKLGIDVATADTGPMAMRDKVPGENPAEMKYQDPVNVSTATEAVAEPKAEGESVAAAGDGEGEEFKKAG
ncbi:MAG: hypothetical protein HY075_11265, partial [Deltaproteobacteria bacterium]|nr:hypothetical protein [Deltaproteobacteria bacterium]